MENKRNESNARDCRRIRKNNFFQNLDIEYDSINQVTKRRRKRTDVEKFDIPKTFILWNNNKNQFSK